MPRDLGNRQQQLLLDQLERVQPPRRDEPGIKIVRKLCRLRILGDQTKCDACIDRLFDHPETALTGQAQACADVPMDDSPTLGIQLET